MEESHENAPRRRTRLHWRDHHSLRVGELLTRSLDYDATVRSIAESAIPHLADWSSVYVPGDGGALSARMVVAHSNPRREAALAALWAERPASLPDSHPHVQTFRRRSHLVLSGEAAARALELTDRFQHDVLVIGPVRSIVAVPLVGHGAILGSLMLVRSRHNRRPADHQHSLEAALDLATCAAQAIHNARRFRDARLSVRLQEERLMNAGYELAELLTRVREHADGIREQLSANSGGTHPVSRGLAHIELVVREIEHLVTELVPSASLDAPIG